MKKVLLLAISQNSQENTAQVFSCEFCEIYKKPFLHNTFERLFLKQKE